MKVRATLNTPESDFELWLLLVFGTPAVAAKRKVAEIVQVAWWRARRRCPVCGSPRRRDLRRSRGCALHQGAWHRCPRCETWHLDNEACLPHAPEPVGRSGLLVPTPEESRRIVEELRRERGF